MTLFLTGAAVIVCIFLISQAASGYVVAPNVALVILSDCDSGYLVKDCGTKPTITQTKSYSIKLDESLQMDSGEKKDASKKPDTKKTKKSKYKSCDKYKDSAKKLNACKKAIDKKLAKLQKTKHDTAKNLAGNVR